MPMTTDKHERVRKIIAELLGFEEDQISPEKTLVDDLCADSLDQIEIVMAVEDEFGIEIADEDGEKVKTVQDAYDLIDRIAH